MYIAKRFSWGIFFSIVLLTSLVLTSFQATVSFASTVFQKTEPIATSVFEHRLLADDHTGEFELPPLPYDYDALEPYIDAQTMMLHHDKHHAGYVRNINTAIAQHPELKGRTLESLLVNIESMPEDIYTAVFNNGGGHSNHTLFWEIMIPNGRGKPIGAIAQAIDDTFGDFETFKEAFNTAGKKRFGSGWAWLVLTQDGNLEVTNTANQASPWMEGNYPIMGNDVWEHAYYLNYQNRRGDYLNNWWNVVNWDVVNERYETATSAL